MTAPRTLPTILCVALACLTGCSWVFVTAPDRRSDVSTVQDCTTHYTAPVIDTALALPPTAYGAVALTAGIIGSANDSESAIGPGALVLVGALLLALSVPLWASASHGYGSVYDCRGMR